MAENDQRAYRDPPSWRGAEERPRAQTDDPLAELARLIGQSVPMNKTGQDRRPMVPEVTDDRLGEIGHATRYAAQHESLREPGGEQDATAPQDERYEQGLDSDFRADYNERYESAARANPAPPRASRFRQEPDFAIERARAPTAGEVDEAAYHETADWHDPSSDPRANRYADEYEDDYEDDAHADDHGYDDDHGDDLQTGRRGGFVFVAAIFVLAVLGTAGAFTYRAMFGAPGLPTLPPIIKAEGGPNKIIPSEPSSKDNITRQADAANAGSGERLVSREERPVDIPPPVTTATRAVSTVPVFPDPPTMGGPGAVVGYSGSPTSINPARSTEPPAPAAPAMNAAIPANPASSGNQVSPPIASVGTTAIAATPAASGPKKIRTVTIRSDESGAPDAAAGVPARPGTQSQGSGGPLSIVPLSTEAPAPPARPRPAPAQAVPLNKPPANQTASAAPATPIASSGGYAVQVSSQRSETEAQSSFRDLQAKYPNVLGNRAPIIRRADLGAKGIYFRAMVGPFASADEASELCSNLKAAGGSCIVQKN